MSTRYDGQYFVDGLGNYIHYVTSLDKDKYLTAIYYANQDLTKYSDGFFLGGNETQSNFTEYQLGTTSNVPRESDQPYASTYLFQGLK